MKPERSPKLKGSWLREISRIQSTLRKKLDMNSILSSLQMQHRRIAIDMDQGIFCKVENIGLTRLGSNSSFQFTIVNEKGEPISNYSGLPSTILIDSHGSVVGYRYQKLGKPADTWRWEKTVFHREDGPATVDTQYLRYKRVIKCIRFYHMDLVHNLSGPAEISFTPTGNYSLVYKWYFYGKEYPLHQVKKMVEKPFNINKQEQMYLKLMLAPQA